MRRLWLGGSFNPVHLGHLTLADSLTQALKTRVFLLPCGASAFGKELASSTVRLQMLKLALADFPRLALDEREINRGGASYTCDTLTELRQTWGPDARLGFVLGEDALAQLHKWKNYRQLLTQANLLVLRRGEGVDKGSGGALPPALAKERLAACPRQVSELIAPALVGLDEWQKSSHGSVLFWHNEGMSVSATRIRELARQEAWEALKSLVPASVLTCLREIKPYTRATAPGW